MKRILGRDDGARLALDRLDQDGCGMGRNRFLEGGCVTIWDGNEAGRVWSERISVQRVAGERDDGDGAPVEVVASHDDLGLVGRDALDHIATLAREFERSL